MPRCPTATGCCAPPVYCETNGDKGYLAREIARRNHRPGVYHEQENKYIKISTYLRKWWPAITWLRGTDPDYLEITAFRDIYPTDNAMDYAGYLRRIRDFKASRDKQLVLGQVILSPEPKNPMLEDLMLQRTYFGYPWQMTVFISASHTRPKVFMLNEANEDWYETGFKLVYSEAAPMTLT